MKKKTFIIVAAVAVVVLGFLASPVLRKKTADDSLPGSAQVHDNLDGMDVATKSNFNREVESMQDKSLLASESMPVANIQILKQADFKPRAHEVEGRAMLIKNESQKLIRFENFKTVNGPDLRIYLSAGLNNKDYIDLGAIRATEGNINYQLPDDTDTEKYTKVLVWCRSFNVLFSYAELEG